MNHLTEAAIIIFSLIGAAIFIGLPIFTYSDLVKNKRRVAFRKHTLWLIVIFTIPVIGSLLYWFQGKSELLREKRTFSPDFSKVRRHKK